MLAQAFSWNLQSLIQVPLAIVSIDLRVTSMLCTVPPPHRYVSQGAHSKADPLQAALREVVNDPGYTGASVQSSRLAKEVQPLPVLLSTRTQAKLHWLRRPWVHGLFCNNVLIQQLLVLSNAC